MRLPFLLQKETLLPMHHERLYSESELVFVDKKLQQRWKMEAMFSLQVGRWGKGWSRGLIDFLKRGTLWINGKGSWGPNYLTVA